MVVKGKLPVNSAQNVIRSCRRVISAPTLAVVSVRLLRVVDLPEEGLPTRAMRGSRGILFEREW